MNTWIFEELRGAAVRRDPNEAELFKTEQTGEGEYAGNDEWTDDTSMALAVPSP
jgi:hypothetical protein